VKRVNIITVLTAALFLSISCLAYGGNRLSSDDTVAFISKTMAEHTSAERKESYAYINFDKCVLSYRVYGTFPVGTLYDIKFSDIDFTSLNYQQSNTGHDYTDFMVLNFNRQARYRINAEDIPIHNVVINTSDSESAKKLFEAFLHLGKLCGADNLQ